jgi:hypothetical protein
VHESLEIIDLDISLTCFSCVSPLSSIFKGRQFLNKASVPSIRASRKIYSEAAGGKKAEQAVAHTATSSTRTTPSPHGGCQGDGPLKVGSFFTAMISVTILKRE